MTQVLSVRWVQSIDTQSIIQDIFDKPDQDRVQIYQKSIGKIWEVFEVTRNNCTWNILKSIEEIQDFILEYNVKFKTKLMLDRFNEEGVRTLSYHNQTFKWAPLRSFLQIEDSQISKIGSFVLSKKSGGRFKDYFCCRLPWQWQKRNFVIIKAGIFYYAESTKEIKEYLPFGKSFKILYGKEQTGMEYGIKLEASHRKLLLFASECRVFCKFIYQVKQTIKQAEGPQLNPFESFAPMRQITHLQFLIDGEKYFEAVYDAFERAEWQIMICGWMISPEFQLKRPINIHKDARLDSVLSKAARRGIKIFILVYNQSSFLTNDSAYTKQTFEKISPNIKILQHPLGVLPTFWSHHEKVVIVDQNEVLMGGLDLCYGRYDTPQHLLTHNDQKWYPGIQYNNIRTKDFTNVREFWKDSVSRVEVARLPWHDVGVHFSGEAAQDVCHHFIEYWNYASFQTHYQDRYLLILQKDRRKHPLIKRIKNGISNKLQSIRNFADQIKQKLFNTNKKEENIHDPKVVQPFPIQIKSEEIKLQLQPKMLLQIESDSHGKLMLEAKSKSSSGSPTSQEIQFESHRTYSSNNQNNDFREQMLTYQSENTEQNFRLKISKKTVSELDEIVEKMEDEIEKIDYINDIRISNGMNQHQRLPVISEEEEDCASSFTCQVLRSVGSWSIGCSPSLRQQSVHNAYLSLIGSSQNFIYIQNQFFVSAIEGCDVIKNKIANAIFNRILKAYHQKMHFKVYVVLPLIPGFAGELDDPQAVIPRVIMHWQYHTIARGESSLIGRLKKEGVNPDDYIVFLSLRTHGFFESEEKSRPVTEIVYLHSKLMIVDDLSAIIGSANINDRSMRGSRDSELCLLVQGKPTSKTTMNKKEAFVNKTIQNLRLQLWKQHFGSDLRYQDPLDVECLNAIKRRAKNNTEIYRRVFHCYPDNEIKKLTKICEWKAERCEVEIYQKEHKQIQGFVVQFPLQFLQDEDLLVGSTLYPDILSV